MLARGEGIWTGGDVINKSLKGPSQNGKEKHAQGLGLSGRSEMRPEGQLVGNIQLGGGNGGARTVNIIEAKKRRSDTRET